MERNGTQWNAMERDGTQWSNAACDTATYGYARRATTMDDLHLPRLPQNLPPRAASDASAPGLFVTLNPPPGAVDPALEVR